MTYHGKYNNLLPIVINVAGLMPVFVEAGIHISNAEVQRETRKRNDGIDSPMLF